MARGKRAKHPQSVENASGRVPGLLQELLATKGCTLGQLAAELKHYGISRRTIYLWQKTGSGVAVGLLSMMLDKARGKLPPVPAAKKSGAVPIAVALEPSGEDGTALVRFGAEPLTCPICKGTGNASSHPLVHVPCKVCRGKGKA